MYRPPGIQEPIEEKSSKRLIVLSVCILLLVCVGAAFFLIQKYNIQITKQDAAAGARIDRNAEPGVVELAPADLA